MPSAHAKLSPSDASRWISCPAAIRAEEQAGVVEEESSYALEGTIAHALCEAEAGREFGLFDGAEYGRKFAEWKLEFDAQKYPDGTLAEMREHVDSYVELLRERMGLYPNSILFLEQRMDSGVEKCWGTSDAVILSPQHIEIVDFKYGSGVAVSAIRNSQLRLYGCGALDTYGDILGDTEVVRMTVHQPRLSSVSTEVLHPDALRMWRDEVVKPAAALALHSDDAPFGPSQSACRWCPLAGTCRARLEKTTREDFGDVTADHVSAKEPETLTPGEIGDVLKRIPDIKSWCSAVEAAALEMAYGRGEKIPGWKVIRSGGQRKITDPTGAIQKLIDLGYSAEKVADFKVKGIGELEKLLGKKEFPVVLEEFLGRTPGRESLVVETDKRAEISPAIEAAAEFSAVTEES